MSDDLIEEMARSVIQKAAGKVLYHFAFKTGPVPMDVLTQMHAQAGISPMLSFGIVIMIRTRDKARMVHHILDSVMKALEATRLIDISRVRQLMVERESSVEELVDLFIVALDD